MCGINFKIAGRGHYNIFSAFKHDLQRRLSRLLKRDVVQENHLSSVVCQGCFRKIQKFEKFQKELDDFVTAYSENESIRVREKRCRQSPALGVGSNGTTKRLYTTSSPLNNINNKLESTCRSPARRSLLPVLANNTTAGRLKEMSGTVSAENRLQNEQENPTTKVEVEYCSSI